MKNLFRKYTFFIVALLFWGGARAQSSGQSMLFNSGWKFHKGDVQGADRPDINTTGWRTVNLPHDWSIEGPFSQEWASATAFLPGGIGWYHKTFTVPAAWKLKEVYVYFDGVYKNSTVWLNGHLLGNRPNGFIPFQYELSKYLNFNGPNNISVKVDHTEFADSRWYTGSGIYRNVYLIAKAPLHMAQWGVQFSTPAVSAGSAQANTRVTVLNNTGKKTTATINCRLIDPAGKVAASGVKTITLGVKDSTSTDVALTVKSPKLWSVEHPQLYTLKVTLSGNGQIADTYTDRVGIRSIKFDADNGFFLNGQNLKLKGVCIHDDAGALGVAVPEGVWRRRLKILKDGGCNSLRMSHNPHADYLYKLCDELGMLVMDEAFDEWEVGKNKWVQGWNVGTPAKNGYHEYFAAWATTDLRDMVLRNYNHPSVIMWSIGNEIDYPNDPYTSEVLNTGRNPQIYGKGYLPDHPPASQLSLLSEKLAKVVKSVDRTRPVTAALAGVVMSNTTTYPENLDIVGYNYQEYRYADDHKAYPKRVIYGSENSMAVGSWNAVDSNKYIAAQYLWTGIDYMGEAGKWPERSNRAGLLDLAGFTKPAYYFRQSLWSAKPMIYIGTGMVPKNAGRGGGRPQAEPTWNWQPGDKMRVTCYTNCTEAELFLNGQSLGKKVQNDARVITWDIDYQPGTLTVKGYNSGQQQATYALKTAGDAALIKATLVNESAGDMKAGLAQIALQVTDKAGIPVYRADQEVTVSIAGNAKLSGLESGSADSHEDYKANKRKLLNGKLLAYIQANPGAGPVKATFTAPGLQTQTITLNFR